MNLPIQGLQLRCGAGKRFFAGHPWVFSNEVEGSPKEISLGGPVELRDASGAPVAYGYGNPTSLITFRALGLRGSPRIQSPFHDLPAFMKQTLLEAWALRSSLGWKQSCRLVYAESDGLPGLIMDRFALTSGHQVLSVQVSTSGMEHLLPVTREFWADVVTEAHRQGLSSATANQTIVVFHRESSARRLEGLPLREPEALSLKGFDLEVSLSQSSVLLDPEVILECDLLGGQKTGLFLDQSANIELLARAAVSSFSGRPVRILDLCCYVGQWSVRLAHELKKAGSSVTVDAVDVSRSALAFAERNLARVGASVQLLELDVLRDLETLESAAYDIVICDPPAFAKSRKDLPTALRAYAKLNAQAFRVVKPGGFVASCSCSGLVSADEFRDALLRALQRSERVARCLATGGHATDHPTLLSFPEGNYLKMHLHRFER